MKISCITGVGIFEIAKDYRNQAQETLTVRSKSHSLMRQVVGKTAPIRMEKNQYVADVKVDSISAVIQNALTQ